MSELATVAIAEAVLLVLLAPLVSGIGRKIRARLGGRAGVGVLAPYAELGRLFRKQVVRSEDASFVTALAPAISFGAMATAAALVPIAGGWPAMAFAGDAFALLGLLAAARFVETLAAYDSGSAAPALASSRTVTVGALAAPTFALALATAALATGATALGPMADALASRGLGGASEAQVLSLAAIAIAVLAEIGHIPLGDPETSEELAPGRQALLSELSGRDAALSIWSGYVKELVLFVLIANVFIPGSSVIRPGIPPAELALALGIVVGKVLAITTGYAFVARATARLRFFRLTDVLGVAFAAALLGAIFALYRGHP